MCDMDPQETDPLQQHGSRHGRLPEDGDDGSSSTLGVGESLKKGEENQNDMGGMTITAEDIIKS